MTTPTNSRATAPSTRAAVLPTERPLLPGAVEPGTGSAIQGAADLGPAACGVPPPPPAGALWIEATGTMGTDWVVAAVRGRSHDTHAGSSALFVVEHC